MSWEAYRVWAKCGDLLGPTFVFRCCYPAFFIVTYFFIALINWYRNRCCCRASVSMLSLDCFVVRSNRWFYYLWCSSQFAPDRQNSGWSISFDRVAQTVHAILTLAVEYFWASTHTTVVESIDHWYSVLITASDRQILFGPDHRSDCSRVCNPSSPWPTKEWSPDSCWLVWPGNPVC